MSCMLLDLHIIDISMIGSGDTRRSRSAEEQMFDAIFSIVTRDGKWQTKTIVKYSRSESNLVSLLLPLISVGSENLYISLLPSSEAQEVMSQPIGLSKVRMSSLASSNGHRFKIPLISPYKYTQRVGSITMALRTGGRPAISN